MPVLVSVSDTLGTCWVLDWCYKQ